MPLFDMTTGSLEPVNPTTFADEGVLERRDLQAAIRADISLLGDDLLVVAEEFGAFRDAQRRIDLLCIDRSAHLVVVELKRTNDGGHMELQALRYAAMVSALTFEDLVDTFEGFLVREGQDASKARSRLAEWLDDGEDAVLSREVRILLASADFGREITTTALWLNEVYNTDIRCVKITHTVWRVAFCSTSNRSSRSPRQRSTPSGCGAGPSQTGQLVLPIRTGPGTSSRHPMSECPALQAPRRIGHGARSASGGRATRPFARRPRSSKVPRREWDA